MHTLHPKNLIALGAAAALLVLPSPGRSADAQATAKPPAWLTSLPFSDKESYDDNVLVVSGLGLPTQSSWVNTATFKIGIDLAPVIAAGPAVQSFSLTYTPERSWYAQASSEDNTTHKIADLFKGKISNFSYSLDNALLVVDGSKLAATYAATQVSGGNQLDKYRNNYTHSVPRERRDQDQDRVTAQVRWDVGSVFIRPLANATWYNLNTYQFSTSKAPYLGYQDYIDRWDVNGGADLGYSVAKGISFFVGYRFGDQHQDQFSPGINSDQHYSSNHYQRVLFGFEGTLAPWLTVKYAGGPDYRDYNPSAPIIHDRTTRYYGEGQATAAISKTQNLSLTYKQWIFVSSTGLVPYDDISYALTYHWSATKALGVDLGAKYLEANYTLGNDLAGSAPSLRDDLDYQFSAGLSYVLAPRLTLTAGYTYDKGSNGLDGLAANYAPSYRDFTHGVYSLGLKYGF
jgi:hypothetical protein